MDSAGLGSQSIEIERTLTGYPVQGEHVGQHDRWH